MVLCFKLCYCYRAGVCVCVYKEIVKKIKKLLIGLEIFTVDMGENSSEGLTLSLLWSGRAMVIKEFVHVVQDKLNHQLLDPHLQECCVSIASHSLNFL